MPRRNLIWALAILAAAGGLLLLMPNSPRWDPSGTADFDPVADAYAKIRQEYLLEVDPDELRRQAIASMVDQLDEYSTYLPPEKAQTFSDRIKGRARGLGLKVEIVNSRVAILGAVEGSPAVNLPLRRGDRLLEIDGLDVSGMELKRIENLLDTGASKEVAITVMHEDGKWEVVRASRGEISVKSVQALWRTQTGAWAHLIDPANGIGYIRIKEILPDTPSDVRVVLRRLDRPRGLVLDLRDNPGGSLPEAADICDMFLRNGVIASIISRGRIETLRANELETYPEEMPVVVLVNGNTASAAELVAGALGRHRRAALVGSPTRGKHCIQRMIRLAEGLGQINLTTSRFVLHPLKGTALLETSQSPIKPHLVVPLDEAAARSLRRLEIQSEAIAFAQVSPSTTDTTPAAESSLADFLQLDAQLNAAVNLLRRPADMAKTLRAPDLDEKE